jgi:hypothetical protein
MTEQLLERVAIVTGRPQVRRRCFDFASGRNAQQLFDPARPDNSWAEHHA